jgi:copper chaperone
METMTLNISGMTCMGCAASVERKLREQPGVSRAVVSLEDAQAEIDFDPQIATAEALKQTLRTAGWGVVS